MRVAKNQGEGDKPLLPEAPLATGQPIGAAKAFHERQVCAEGGGEGDEDGPGNDANGARVVHLEIGLDERHGVSRQDAAEGHAQVAADGIGLWREGEQGRHHQQRREQAQDGRVGGGFGVGENAVSERPHAARRR